jgi:hypothetical protein
MNKDERWYEDALDVSVVIASAKSFLFAQIWKAIKPRVKKTVSPRNLEMVRRLVREYVSGLPDEDFFISLEVARSKETLEAYLKERFETQGLMERIIREFDEQIARHDKSLRDFSE